MGVEGKETESGVTLSGDLLLSFSGVCIFPDTDFSGIVLRGVFFCDMVGEFFVTNSTLGEEVAVDVVVGVVCDFVVVRF